MNCLKIMEWQMTVVLYVELNLLDLHTVMRGVLLCSLGEEEVKYACKRM
jgi:hypothetical protein